MRLVGTLVLLSLLVVAAEDKEARVTFKMLKKLPLHSQTAASPCQNNMDAFRDALKQSSKEYKLILEEKSEKIGELLGEMKSSSEQERTMRFEKLAETLLKNEMFVSKFQNNNLLVEVMHLVAMFLSEKLDNVDKKLVSLETTAKSNEHYLEKLLEEIRKIPSVENRLEQVEADLSNAKVELMQKMDTLEATESERESTINATILEMEAGFKIVQQKLDAGEEKSRLRHDQTQSQIKEMKVTDLMSKVSTVHEKIAFFEENLQSQHLFLEKMDNRSIDSFSEVKSRLKKLAGCNRAVKLNLTSLETGTYYFSNFYLNWTRANEFCKKNGMHLGTLESEEEMDLLDNAAPHQNFYYWLSASDAGRMAGQYYWSDGRKVDKNWWYRGSQTEPDSFTNGQDTCVFLYTYYGKLFDGACSGNRYFICELLPGCLD